VGGCQFARYSQPSPCKAGESSSQVGKVCGYDINVPHTDSYFASNWLERMAPSRFPYSCLVGEIAWSPWKQQLIFRRLVMSRYRRDLVTTGPMYMLSAPPSRLRVSTLMYAVPRPSVFIWPDGIAKKCRGSTLWPVSTQNVIQSNARHEGSLVRHSLPLRTIGHGPRWLRDVSPLGPYKCTAGTIRGCFTLSGMLGRAIPHG
jgi:hypothetical protein